MEQSGVLARPITSRSRGSNPARAMIISKMKFFKKDIKVISAEFLKLMDKESVFANEDLERMVGKEINGNISGDRLVFDNRPSDLGTMAYTVSYVREGTGIPLELKINPSLDYVRVIVKLQDCIFGYDPFSADIFENIIQAKLLKSNDLSLSREELRYLSEMQNSFIN